MKKNQMSLKLKKKKSNFIINNDFRRYTINSSIKKIKKYINHL